MYYLLWAACLLLVAVSTPASASTYLYSSFQTDTEGWTINTYPLGIAGGTGPAQVSTGGSSYIETEDTANGMLFFVAPSSWTGDFFGGSLSFLIRNANPQNYSYLSNPDPYSNPSVLIRGGGPDLYLGGFLAVNGVGWTSNTIPLTTGAPWSTAQFSNVPATDQQIQATLSSITGIYINADWVTGYYGKPGRDDVLLGHDITDLGQVSLTGTPDVPEPATTLLVLVGFSGILVARLCRRRI